MSNWFHKTFKAHPESIDESWLEHSQVAFRISGRLFVASLQALIHGVCPRFFECSASEAIKALHADISVRNKEKDCCPD